MQQTGSYYNLENRTHSSANSVDDHGFYLAEYLNYRRNSLSTEKMAREIDKKRAILNIPASEYFVDRLGFPAYFKYGVAVGNLSNTYTEYSGGATPHLEANADYLWFIEDGTTNFVLAINKNTAALAGKWTMAGVAANSTDVGDIEDVTSFAIGGVGYIVLADTGDNANARTTFRLFRVKEPTVTGSNGTIAAGDRETIICQYPPGSEPNHKDAECLMADPATGDLYIITKRAQVSGPSIKCYRLAYQSSYSGTQTLQYMGGLTNDATLNTLSTTISGNNGYVTGGSISPDGDEIVLRSYSQIYLWKRQKGETIYEALSRVYDYSFTDIYVGGGIRNFHPAQEPQGEVVTFDYYGTKLYTCSELVATEGSAGASSSNPLFMYERAYRAPLSVSFQNGANGYSGCEDTYIDQTTTGAANTTNFSTRTNMVLDLDFSPYPAISRRRQALIKWDTSAIPTTATVVGAYITFYISTEGKQFAMYKMLQSWDAATITYANSGGILTDGVEASASADILFGTTLASGALDGYTGFVKVNVPLAIAQAWVTNPSTNFGFMATGGPTESTGDGLQIESSESLTQDRKPKLTIIYLPAV